MENFSRVEIPVNLKDNKSSNLFLRKLFSELSLFEFMATPVKDSEEKIVVLGVLTFGGSNNQSVRLSCRYEKKGCIKSMIFYDIDPNIPISYLKSLVEEALDKYKNEFKEARIGYSFESGTHYIKPVSTNKFEISVNGDDGYLNSIAFSAEGYDLDDVFNFNKYIVESVLDCLSIYYDMPFDERHILSNRFRSILSPEELINTDPNFVPYKEIELDPFMIQVIETIVTINKDDFDKSKIFKMARLFRDGRRVEYYGLNSFSINFKEIAHSLYMSCLEVMAEDPSKNVKCKECGQDVFKISQRVSDLIYEMSASESLKKFIKMEYGKRSKFLHAGSYFSSNSVVINKYIPQIAIDSDHGHILQVNNFETLRPIKELLRSLFIKEFDHLR